MMVRLILIACIFVSVGWASQSSEESQGKFTGTAESAESSPSDNQSDYDYGYEERNSDEHGDDDEEDYDYGNNNNKRATRDNNSDEEDTEKELMHLVRKWWRIKKRTLHQDSDKRDAESKRMAHWMLGKGFHQKRRGPMAWARQHGRSKKPAPMIWAGGRARSGSWPKRGGPMAWAKSMGTKRIGKQSSEADGEAKKRSRRSILTPAEFVDPQEWDQGNNPYLLTRKRKFDGDRSGYGNPDMLQGQDREKRHLFAHVLGKRVGWSPGTYEEGPLKQRTTWNMAPWMFRG